MTPLHKIRRWLRPYRAWRRHKRLMAALGCEEAARRVQQARKQHRPYAAHQRVISTRLHEALGAE